jgi:hypothetical protein
LQCFAMSTEGLGELQFVDAFVLEKGERRGQFPAWAGLAVRKSGPRPDLRRYRCDRLSPTL